SVHGAFAFAYYDHNPKKEKSVRRAIALQEQLASEFPTQPEYQRDLAASYSRLGAQLMRIDRPEAEKVLRQALRIREKLADQHLGVVGYQEAFGDSMGQLASYLYGHHRLPEAEKLINRRLEIQKTIAAGFPGVALH